MGNKIFTDLYVFNLGILGTLTLILSAPTVSSKYFKLDKNK